MKNRLTEYGQFAVAAIIAIAASKAIAEPAVEVLHLWRTPAEKHALYAFREPLEAQGVKWHDIAVEGGATGVEEQLSGMLILRKPPSIVQWIPQANSLDLFDQGIFEPLQEADDDVGDTLIDEIRDLAIVDGKLHFMPVGIHTYNFMVYNREILDSYGLEQPETWEEFLSYGPILADDGIALFAVSDEDWQLQAFMRILLMSKLTKTQYEEMALGSGGLEKFKPQLLEAADLLLRLKEFAHPEQLDQNWEDVSARVENGEALSQFLGDYIVANFAKRENIICARSPESTHMQWGYDSFAFTVPTSEEMREGQLAFARAVTTPEILAEYVIRKGGVPVIKTVTPDDLDKCNAETLRNWEQTEKLWNGSFSVNKRSVLLLDMFTNIWHAEDPMVSDAINELSLLFDKL